MVEKLEFSVGVMRWDVNFACCGIKYRVSCSCDEMGCKFGLLWYKNIQFWSCDEMGCEYCIRVLEPIVLEFTSHGNPDGKIRFCEL